MARMVAICATALNLVGCEGPSQRSAHLSEAPSPAAGMSLAQVNERAAGLVREGRSLESLPFFRRQFELLDAEGYTAPNLWAAHRDFASALHNAALETGPNGPATRSSFERVALLREAFAELATAESLVANGDGRAVVGEDAAQTLWFWGFPRDGWRVLERTVEVLPRESPRSGAVAARKRLVERIMATPQDPDLQWHWKTP